MCSHYLPEGQIVGLVASCQDSIINLITAGNLYWQASITKTSPRERNNKKEKHPRVQIKTNNK